MGIRLTKEHSSIIKDQVKLVGIYIKSIIDRVKSTRKISDPVFKQLLRFARE